MKKIVTGKTKDLFDLGDGRYRMVFKNSVTGKDGVFDPGENQIGLEVEGMGLLNLRVSTMFFNELEKRGIRTHYLRTDLEENSMDVLAVEPFGHGLEVICRYRAVGSFLRRYGKYVKEGDRLDGYVEATLKDDERCDPLITREGLEALSIMSEKEWLDLKKNTREIASVIAEILSSKGLELYDIKFEYGRTLDGEVILMDEMSSGNMRVYRGDEKLGPVELSELLLGEK